MGRKPKNIVFVHFPICLSGVTCSCAQDLLLVPEITLCGVWVTILGARHGTRVGSMQDKCLKLFPIALPLNIKLMYIAPYIVGTQIRASGKSGCSLLFLSLTFSQKEECPWTILLELASSPMQIWCQILFYLSFVFPEPNFFSRKCTHQITWILQVAEHLEQCMEVWMLFFGTPSPAWGTSTQENANRSTSISLIWWYKRFVSNNTKVSIVMNNFCVSIWKRLSLNSAVIPLQCREMGKSLSLLGKVC